MKDKFIPVARPKIGLREIGAVNRVLLSGNLAQGPKVSEFEKKFAQLCGTRHAIAVNSGTSALHLSLLSAGIGPGDEVIVPSFSFAATANSVALTGAKPVFVDVEENFFNIDPKKIEEALTPRTKAIMPVHLYGHPADMPAILEIAKSNELLVFEDAAQAHGASILGRPVGSFGHAASFSFYPTKNMTSGEGGMITTGDDSIDRNSRLYRNQGMEKRYVHEVVGFNNRMTDVHAAIGLEQLKKLNSWNQKRRKNADYLIKNLSGVLVPQVSCGFEHVFHQFTIRVVDQDRDKFSESLKKLQVGSGVYYPTPIHELASFGRSVDLPVTKKLTREVLSLPVHPNLTERELERIVSAVNKLSRAGS